MDWLFKEKGRGRRFCTSATWPNPQQQSEQRGLWRRGEAEPEKEVVGGGGGDGTDEHS